MMEINFFLALIAGLGSFFAPCILPIVPAFLAYISGITISDLKKSSGIKIIDPNGEIKTYTELGWDHFKGK